MSLSSPWQQEPSQQAQPRSSSAQQGQHQAQQDDAGDERRDARTPLAPWLPLLLYRARYTVQAGRTAAIATTATSPVQEWRPHTQPDQTGNADNAAAARQQGALGASEGDGGAPVALDDLLTQFWREQLWMDQQGHSRHDRQHHQGSASHSSDQRSHSVGSRDAPSASHSTASHPAAAAEASSARPATTSAPIPHPAAAGTAASHQLALLPAPDVQVEITDWQGELCPKLQGASWSTYYESHGRTPDNLELAPWVAGLYARRLANMKQASA